MIEVSGLTFDYPGHRALNNIHLSVAKGSVTALVGPNGAGKTTLMRCIAGLETPLTGSIAVAGINVQEYPREAHRNMGYLSDFFGLYQDLSVAQCFEYAAASQGLPANAIANAIQLTAAQLGLSDKLHVASGNLSRGQRQRVAIGQAIIHQPKLLLLDEPASGLDPEARGSLAGLFRQLQAAGMTLLVSSHILAELDEYSTHMLALENGRVLDNRALNSSTQAQTFKRFALKLAEPHQGLLAYLQQQAIKLVTGDTQSASFEFAGDSAAQAALLKALIEAGFCVLSFTQEKENLQHSYLQSVAHYRTQNQVSEKSI